MISPFECGDTWEILSQSASDEAFLFCFKNFMICHLCFSPTSPFIFCMRTWNSSTKIPISFCSIVFHCTRKESHITEKLNINCQRSLVAFRFSSECRKTEPRKFL